MLDFMWPFTNPVVIKKIKVVIVYDHGRAEKKLYDRTECDKCSAGHRTAPVQQVSPVQTTVASPTTTHPSPHVNCNYVTDTCYLSNLLTYSIRSTLLSKLTYQMHYCECVCV